MNRISTLGAVAILVSALVFSFSQSAHADALKMADDGPSMDEINVMREKIGDFMHSLKGVNGTGISACEKSSGQLFYKMKPADVKKSEFVNCFVVSTEEETSKAALDVLLPAGSKFMGIYVPVEHIGKVVLQ